MLSGTVESDTKSLATSPSHAHPTAASQYSLNGEVGSHFEAEKVEVLRGETTCLGGEPGSCIQVFRLQGPEAGEGILEEAGEGFTSEGRGFFSHRDAVLEEASCGLRWALKKRGWSKLRRVDGLGRHLEAGLDFALTQGWALGEAQREKRTP